MTHQEHQTLKQLAGLYLNHGRLNEALTLLQALRVMKTDAAVDLALAYVLLLQKDYQGALAPATRAATQYPGRAALLKARALWGLQQIQESRQAMSLFLQGAEHA